MRVRHLFPAVLVYCFLHPSAEAQPAGEIHQALQKAGVDSTFQVIANAGHGFGGPEIEQGVSAFWEKHLK